MDRIPDDDTIASIEVHLKIYEIRNGFENHNADYINTILAFINTGKDDMKFEIDETIEYAHEKYHKYKINKTFCKKECVDYILDSFYKFAQICGIEYVCLELPDKSKYIQLS